MVAEQAERHRGNMQPSFVSRNQASVKGKGKQPDLFQVISSMINKAILLSDFRQVNLYSQTELLAQVQHFLQTLKSVSDVLFREVQQKWHEGDLLNQRGNKAADEKDGSV